ncbi:hypothetical protein NP493_364g04088 [Ridgeia piscesae]|uniref:Uncharacterized protein n=1 Tax=Ridgeia piscesae TaxID=27915 RepID=A0AAD9NW23_RIDPI|nr:hypothetical protein NP493_364g04088 [Ridgeia piscesae]
MTRPAVCDPSTASPQDRRVRHMTAAAQVGVGRLEAAAAAGNTAGSKVTRRTRLVESRQRTTPTDTTGRRLLQQSW